MMQYLILKYPLLANYITESVERGNTEELMDFLFALETDEVPYFNWV